jgi:hypothetical protein
VPTTTGSRHASAPATAALAQWTDRANDAMLHLLRGQVTREIRQAGDAPR